MLSILIGVVPTIDFSDCILFGVVRKISYFGCCVFVAIESLVDFLYTK